MLQGVTVLIFSTTEAAFTSYDDACSLGCSMAPLPICHLVASFWTEMATPKGSILISIHWINWQYPTEPWAPLALTFSFAHEQSLPSRNSSAQNQRHVFRGLAPPSILVAVLGVILIVLLSRQSPWLVESSAWLFQGHSYFLIFVDGDGPFLYLSIFLRF